MVDWSKAPEGTTHWGPDTSAYCESWYRLIGDDELFVRPDSTVGWRKLSESMKSARRMQLVKAPKDRTSTPRIVAHEFLERGVSHMRDRAVQRDSEAGERSMARAVAAFNAQEGANLTEAQGWRFMIQLKYARAVNGVFVADDYEDMAAYSGLAGEAAQG